MKFSTKILTLLVATTAAFSRNVPIKRGANDDKCISELKDNKDCYDTLITTLTNENYDENCKIYASEKCQKFYSEVDKIPNVCFDNNKGGLTRDGARQLVAQFKYLCVKDEKGKLCPAVDILINLQFKSDYKGTKEEQEEEYQRPLEETCYSKKCTDALAEYNKAMLNDQKILEMMATHNSIGANAEEFKKNFEKDLKFLSSKNCTEKAGTKTPELYSENHYGKSSSTSDASTSYVKMSSMVMVTLSVIYYLL